ncbi:hypothetical protein Droror1_Dr00016461 [Drosera rotundifolia]
MHHRRLQTSKNTFPTPSASSSNQQPHPQSKSKPHTLKSNTPTPHEQPASRKPTTQAATVHLDIKLRFVADSPATRQRMSSNRRHLFRKEAYRSPNRKHRSSRNLGMRGFELGFWELGILECVTM